MGLEIYCDGGCNVHTDNKGAWAFIVVDLEKDEVIYDESGSKDKTTNSEMEVLALLHALKFAEGIDPTFEVVIKSDSQYCVNAYTKWTFGWKKRGWIKADNNEIKHLKWWKLIHNLRFRHVSVEWVRGHNGNRWNEYVDKLTKDYR